MSGHLKDILKVLMHTIRVCMVYWCSVLEVCVCVCSGLNSYLSDLKIVKKSVHTIWNQLLRNGLIMK